MKFRTTFIMVGSLALLTTLFSSAYAADEMWKHGFASKEAFIQAFDTNTMFQARILQAFDQIGINTGSKYPLVLPGTALDDIAAVHNFLLDCQDYVVGEKTSDVNVTVQVFGCKPNNKVYLGKFRTFTKGEKLLISPNGVYVVARINDCGNICYGKVPKGAPLTPIPTRTPIPTLVPIPTMTPVPTDTPIPAPTPTPYPTPTETPIPSSCEEAWHTWDPLIFVDNTKKVSATTLFGSPLSTDDTLYAGIDFFFREHLEQDWRWFRVVVWVCDQQIAITDTDRAYARDKWIRDQQITLVAIPDYMANAHVRAGSSDFNIGVYAVDCGKGTKGDCIGFTLNNYDVGFILHPLGGTSVEQMAVAHTACITRNGDPCEPELVSVGFRPFTAIGRQTPTPLPKPTHKPKPPKEKKPKQETPAAAWMETPNPTSTPEATATPEPEKTGKLTGWFRRMGHRRETPTPTPEPDGYVYAGTPTPEP